MVPEGSHPGISHLIGPTTILFRNLRTKSGRRVLGIILPPQPLHFDLICWSIQKIGLDKPCNKTYISATFYRIRDIAHLKKEVTRFPDAPIMTA
jgi:hypothetical protein